MPNIPFYKAGQLGLIRDVAAEEISPQAWSDGRNIRFEDGRVLRAPGFVEAFPNELAGDPSWVMATYTPTQVFWLYANLTDLYITNGTQHAEATRAVGGDYSTLDRVLWNGGILSGIPIITNFADVPQAMVNGPNLVNDFEDLPNWPAVTLCKVIKPFKQFMVAMNVTKGGTNFQHLVKWSHPAVPGAVPSSWDEADPSLLAGEVELGDSEPGGIQDGLVLRDTMIIYKDNTTWGMQFIGGNNIFRFYPIFTSSGILSTHCVGLIRKGTMHCVATGDDVVVHDGQNVDSILDQRMKRWLRNNIAENEANRSFIVVHNRKEEVWFCFPEIGSEYPSTALIWNWRDNTLALRGLPEGTTHGNTGPVSPGGEVWDQDSEVWDSDSSIWDTISFRVHFMDILMASPSEGKLYQLDTAFEHDGVGYTSYVERTGIALVGQDRVSGEFKADHSVRKIATRVWIKARGSPFMVQLGSHEDVSGEEAPTYQAAQMFTPGVDKYLDFTTNGRYIAIKIFVEDNIGDMYDIEGFNIMIEVLGEQ